jgi:enamine deaminase RidA (YjgF/YER057c/UK114 family)
MGRPVTPHEVVNPATLAPARGFSHVVVAAPGRLVFLGGQTAHDREGRLGAGDLVGQFDAAAANLVVALSAVGGAPEHLVSLQIFTTDGEGYRAALGEVGEAYRRHLGTHYPATSWFEVAELFDPAALVELVGVAVLPD